MFPLLIIVNTADTSTPSLTLYDIGSKPTTARVVHRETIRELIARAQLTYVVVYDGNIGSGKVLHFRR